MKKLAAILLVASISFSVVACAGNNSSTSNNSASQESNESTTNNSDTEATVDYADIISDDKSYWGNLSNQFRLPIGFAEDNILINTAAVEIGTWELMEDTVAVTLEDGNTTSYEIKNINGAYFLVGSDEILYDTKSSIDKSDLPIKEVDVTSDNWQEYFEVYSEPEEIVDVFGEVTKGDEKYYLKLKDAYFKYLVRSQNLDLSSYTNLRYRYPDSEDENESQMDIHNFTDDFAGPCCFGCYLYEADFEMVKIQGTLYFLDIE